MTRRPRPTRTDGEATRARLLEAAGRLFAAGGFAETTNTAIAAEAEADIASINYHFRSRAGLYREVLLEAHRRMITVDELTAIAETAIPPQEKLRAFIARIVEQGVQGQGWHARVLSREVLSPSSHLEFLPVSEIGAKMEIVLRILSEITGLAPQDPALRRSLFSVLGPCAMLLVAAPRISPLADDVLGTDRDVLVEHLCSFALGGLAAIAAAR
ncbi:TetR/AcrR family transcriptional regulator [Alloyangia pacifica]|uniref:Transcriptional regulator, TetR family n=1 Tax=Alloyangia pacifica TaxID=311180 RepID=A0A1I6QYM8_9RHOB|nr:CerR family C-terminal domain-containing protein [Alloyangia pacifica]SDG05696.1 transcriptional regulator, TetR family [Alloyangia pacifica]SFS57524.1 transcriptional regulator, TetR family [Alloyangia pacifica]